MCCSYKSFADSNTSCQKVSAQSLRHETELQKMALKFRSSERVQPVNRWIILDPWLWLRHLSSAVCANSAPLHPSSPTRPTDCLPAWRGDLWRPAQTPAVAQMLKAVHRGSQHAPHSGGLWFGTRVRGHWLKCLLKPMPGKQWPISSRFIWLWGCVNGPLCTGLQLLTVSCFGPRRWK